MLSKQGAKKLVLTFITRGVRGIVFKALRVLRD